jgi:hypothetical protein
MLHARERRHLAPRAAERLEAAPRRSALPTTWTAANSFPIVAARRASRARAEQIFDPVAVTQGHQGRAGEAPVGAISCALWRPCRRGRAEAHSPSAAFAMMFLKISLVPPAIVIAR